MVFAGRRGRGCWQPRPTTRLMGPGWSSSSACPRHGRRHAAAPEGLSRGGGRHIRANRSQRRCGGGLKRARRWPGRSNSVHPLGMPRPFDLIRAAEIAPGLHRPPRSHMYSDSCRGERARHQRSPPSRRRRDDLALPVRAAPIRGSRSIWPATVAPVSCSLQIASSVCRLNSDKGGLPESIRP